VGHVCVHSDEQCDGADGRVRDIWRVLEQCLSLNIVVPVTALFMHRRTVSVGVAAGVAKVFDTPLTFTLTPPGNAGPT
jgi:hypothetical protein